VCGGFGEFAATIECFNMSRMKWEPKKSMHTPRFHHAAVVIADTLYVTGGMDAEEHGMFSVEQFSPHVHAKGEWYVMPSMLTPRCLHASFAWQGQVIVFCGLTDNLPTTYNTCIERWQVASSIWENVPALSPIRQGCGVALVGHYVYLSGGEDPSGVFTSLSRYSLIDNVWETLPSMRVKRKHHTLSATRGHLYVFGGVQAMGRAMDDDYPEEQRLNTVERFDLQRKVWQDMPAMREVRYCFACARVGRAHLR